MKELSGEQSTVHLQLLSSHELAVLNGKYENETRTSFMMTLANPHPGYVANNKDKFQDTSRYQNLGYILHVY